MVFFFASSLYIQQEQARAGQAGGQRAGHAKTSQTAQPTQFGPPKGGSRFGGAQNEARVKGDGALSN